MQPAYIVFIIIVIVTIAAIFKKNNFSRSFNRFLDLNDNGIEYFGKISHLTPLNGGRRENATVMIYKSGEMAEILVSVPVKYQYRSSDYVKVVVTKDNARIKGTVSRKEIPTEIKEALDKAVS